eukprot:7107730-Lingulodinium_polyedra.AAC.1
MTSPLTPPSRGDASSRPREASPPAAGGEQRLQPRDIPGAALFCPTRGQAPAPVRLAGHQRPGTLRALLLPRPCD